MGRRVVFAAPTEGMPIIRGERIRHLRTSQGISQAKLGHAIGVNGSYISRLENDLVKEPSRAIIEGIARAVGVNVEELHRADVPTVQAAGRTRHHQFQAGDDDQHQLTTEISQLQYIAAVMQQIGPLIPHLKRLAPLLQDLERLPSLVEQMHASVSQIATAPRRRRDAEEPAGPASGAPDPVIRNLLEYLHADKTQEEQQDTAPGPLVEDFTAPPPKNPAVARARRRSSA